VLRGLDVAEGVREGIEGCRGQTFVQEVRGGQPVTARDQVVEPSQVLVGRRTQIVRLGVGVGIAGGGFIREGDDLIEEGPGDGADAIGRDHVAGKGPPGKRVDEGDRPPLEDRLREVPRPLGRGRDARRAGSRLLLDAQALVGHEEESPVLDERTAQGGPELVLVELQPSAREGVLPVQGVVAKELEGAPVQRVGA